MTTLKTDVLKPLSRRLRNHFDNTMSDRHNANRFVWDWWHLPGRYTHLRTPAELFFPEDLYLQIETGLKKVGRDLLGCSEISPIWLSNYVEGCEQRLHADRPHGPWAFVLALNLNSNSFSGGETMMLRQEILEFWKNPAPAGVAFEEENIVQKIAPKFGRLLIFDPRIPHGVSRVSGTVNPLEGRLVLHGWFTPPNPFVEGSLKPRQIEKVLADFDSNFARLSEPLSTGTLAYRISITASGKVTKVQRMASTMRDSRPLDQHVRKFFAQAKFPKAKGPSRLMLPLTIEV
ncbi:MAG: 2OG-Fe(II) oxygenase [Bdellovibrionales bacterium]|nr:2OG-Fe(II) oxygenase [Bdellovibrionales bacterium]